MQTKYNYEGHAAGEIVSSFNIVFKCVCILLVHQTLSLQIIGGI